MATFLYRDGNYRDENARRTPGEHRSRHPVDNRSGPRVRVITDGEETAIQGTENPASPVKSFREDGNDMSFLDDIALLRRGFINKSSTKAPFARTYPEGAVASEPIKHHDRSTTNIDANQSPNCPPSISRFSPHSLPFRPSRVVVYSMPAAVDQSETYRTRLGSTSSYAGMGPITLAELESRGLNINGQVVYTLPRGTKYSSKARPSKLAPPDASSTSRSWLTSTSASDASVAALVNDSKKPAVKTGELQRLPDGTIVEKIDLGKERVRYLIETNNRITTVEKGKRGSVIFSNLKGQ